MNFAGGLSFDRPVLVALAVVLPIVVGMFLRARARQREARLARFASHTTLGRLVDATSGANAARTSRLIAVAMLAGLALAGPRWGLARGPATARGIDMALALDASLSMLAPDERPSRLERMKQDVRRLRSMSQADRIALMAFAGRSYILTPLTSDDGAIELFLENLDPSVVGQAGSSISRAIRQGTELLSTSDGGADRALIVMSDGESFEPPEDLKTAAEEAAKQGVSLVTVGYGTLGGATIPVRTGSVVEEKRDQQGNVVVTKYSPELLKQAADAAGGTFIPAESSDKASRIRAALRSLRTANRRIESREDRIPRHVWLVVPALLLLLYDTYFADRSRRSRIATTIDDAMTTPPSAGITATLALLLLTMVACKTDPDPAALFAEGNASGAVAVLRKQIAEGDTTVQTRYNLATGLIALDSLGAAAEALEQVRRVATGEARMRARFNAGYAHLVMARDTTNPERESAYASARAAYRAYLEDRITDGDGKWNYELALRKPPPNNGGGGGSGGENPQQQKEDDKPQQSPGGLDQRQAEALLNSAAREERDTQGRRQRQSRNPPNVGKDW